MKVIITGISGAMARMLAEQLHQGGHEVLGIDRRPWPDCPRGIRTFKADIRDVNFFRRVSANGDGVDPHEAIFPAPIWSDGLVFIRHSPRWLFKPVPMITEGAESGNGGSIHCRYTVGRCTGCMAQVGSVWLPPMARLTQ